MYIYISLSNVGICVQVWTLVNQKVCVTLRSWELQMCCSLELFSAKATVQDRQQSMMSRF